MNTKPTRPKRCKSCKEQFTPARPLQSVCGPACAWVVGHAKLVKKREEEAKVQRQKDRKARECLKTRSSYMKEAQREFNAYIRLRDAGKPCICCGVALSTESIGGAYDAGHYRSVGSAPHLRFEENNCHAQTKKCNRYGAGRAVDYRKGLIHRIGMAAVESIEADQEPRHYDISDLKAIKEKYKKMARELKRNAV